MSQYWLMVLFWWVAIMVLLLLPFVLSDWCFLFIILDLEKQLRCCWVYHFYCFVSLFMTTAVYSRTILSVTVSSVLLLVSVPKSILILRHEFVTIAQERISVNDQLLLVIAHDALILSNQISASQLSNWSSSVTFVKETCCGISITTRYHTSSPITTFLLFVVVWLVDKNSLLTHGEIIVTVSIVDSIFCRKVYSSRDTWEVCQCGGIF